MVLALVAVYFAVNIYRGHQRTAREAALGRAIQIQETSVGPAAGGGANSFPTQQVKDQVALKAFNEVETKYSGNDEGEIAGYWIGSIQADQGKLADAEQSFQKVAEKGDEQYGSLAKLSLAQCTLPRAKWTRGRSCCGI